MTSMGIQELAARTGIAAHTLRYYEQEGLMIPVARDAAGRRSYTDEHFRWVSFLLRLREGGMGITKIRRYVTLIQAGGDSAGAERLSMLRQHRDDVRARIKRLTHHLKVLERKVAEGCAPD